MNITNITSDDENISNATDISDTNIEIVITPLLGLITTIPCALSFICLLTFMIYTLLKPLSKNKYIYLSVYKWKRNYTHLIQSEV